MSLSTVTPDGLTYHQLDDLIDYLACALQQGFEVTPQEGALLSAACEESYQIYLTRKRSRTHVHNSA